MATVRNATSNVYHALYLPDKVLEGSDTVTSLVKGQSRIRSLNSR